MKTPWMKASTIGWRSLVFAAGLLLPAVALATPPAGKPPARVPAECRLILEGRQIETLKLTGPGGQAKTIARPGAVVTLPAGRYAIKEIQLAGQYSAYDYDPAFNHSADSLTLTPEQPCRPTFGAPLTPGVTVKRNGASLELNYRLVDGDGRKYVSGNRTNPPTATVYRGDRVIASGSFEYG